MPERIPFRSGLDAIADRMPPLPSSQNPVPFRILALHGGGIHGVATASYLESVEADTGTRIREHFDLITGTSTGGIIALALSLDIPASDIKTLYLEHGHAIFSRKLPWLPKKVAQLAAPLYRLDGLRSRLRQIFGLDTLLGEARCRLCIPTVNITTGRNEVLKTRHHPRFERDHKLPMWQVGTATAAAPTYFPPAHLPTRGHYVDGGLWANAPIEVGISEALHLGIDRSDITVLSLGTGDRAFYKHGVKDRLLGSLCHGIIGWGGGLVDLAMRSQTQRSRNLTEYLLPDGHLHHIDFDLPSHLGGLDAVSDAGTLAEIAKSTAKSTLGKLRPVYFQSKAAPFAPIP